MLRKRSKVATNKEQTSPDQAPISSSSSPLFSVPKLFVALSSKVMPDYGESARSPTSPLEYKLFSSLTTTLARSPRSPHKSWEWDSGKVGLGLVDSLTDETNPKHSKTPLGETKNIVFGPKMRINIPSTNAVENSQLVEEPNSNVQLGFMKSNEHELWEFRKTRSCSANTDRAGHPSFSDKLKSSSEVFSSGLKGSRTGSQFVVAEGSTTDYLLGSLPGHIASSHEFVDSLSASDIELSEDYTCIISHGPNPKTTHIFGDRIIESLSNPFLDSENKNGEGIGSSLAVNRSELPMLGSHSGDFLSFCHLCKKKLELGEDIYMYRGEMAFCSWKCRDLEIMNEEEIEKTKAECCFSPPSIFDDEIFLEGVADAR